MLYIIGYNAKDIGGIESFSRTLMSNISGCLNLCEYDINSNQYSIDEDKYYGVLKHNFFFRVLNKLSKGRLAKYLMKSIVNQNVDDNYYILNTPKYLDIVPNLERTILIQHTSADNWWNSKQKFNRSQILLEKARMVNSILALSEKDKVELVDKFGFDKQRVRVLSLPTTFPLLSEVKSRNKNIVMVCRLENDIKRVDLVIDSMALLPDFNLIIVGDGRDYSYLKSRAEHLKNVSFVGATAHPMYYLDLSFLLVISSEFEGFPISAIEAKTRGLSIIARDTFNSAEEITSGCGVLIPAEWNPNSFKMAVEECYFKFETYSARSIDSAKAHQIENVKLVLEEMLYA